MAKRVYNKLEFSLEEEESLIDFVKQNEALYNPKSKHYKNKMFRDRLWEDIGSMLKKSGSDCQRKWINIRDTYQKTRGKKPGTGSAAESTKQRNELLAFLGEISTVNKKTTSNVIFDDIIPENVEIETISDDDDIETKENSPPSKRRRNSSNSDQIKLYETFTKTIKDNHTQKMSLMQSLGSTNAPTELELYFGSICKTVEKLKPIEQAKIKMQISNLVTQAELAELQSALQLQFPHPVHQQNLPNYTSHPNYYQNQNYYDSNPTYYSGPTPPQSQTQAQPAPQPQAQENSIVSAVNSVLNL